MLLFERLWMVGMAMIGNAASIKRGSTFTGIRLGPLNANSLHHQDTSSSSSSSLPNVIVVGAGLAGLATALGLANTGKFHVDLVELRSDFSRTGAALGLAPHGIKALEEIDPDGVMTILRPLGTERMRTGDIKVLLFGWWMVRDALLERVRAKSECIRLHMGYTLQDIVDDPKEESSLVKATFVPYKSKKGEKSSITETTTNQEEDVVADLCSNENLTLEGCLLVGADGVRSSIRKFLHRRPPEIDKNITAWWGRIRVDPLNPGDTDVALHERLAPLLDKGVFPLGGFPKFGPSTVAVVNFHSTIPGWISWVITTRSESAAAASNKNAWTQALEGNIDREDDRLIMQAILALSDPNAVNHPNRLCVVEPPAEDGNGWGGHGRVVLIGDAAHAMRAATGQGGNLAFEDAAILCRVLREWIQKQEERNTGKASTEETMAQAVLKIENERLPRVRKIWKVEDAMADQNDKASNNTVILQTPDYLKWVYDGV